MYRLPAFWNSGRSLPPPDLDLHGPTERLRPFSARESQQNPF